MLKLTKNNAGFTLMEIVIAAGLLGFLAIGFLKFQQNQMKSTKTSINKAELNNYFQAMKAYLAKPGSCKKTFEELGEMRDGLVVESILRADGSEKYVVGDKVKGTNYKLASLTTSDVFINKENSKAPFRGEAILNIELSRYNETSYGMKSLKKSLEIDMYIDEDGKVHDCGVLGGIYIPLITSSANDDVAQKNEYDVAQKNEYDEAFERSIKQASQKTGQDISQEDIRKAIDSNPEIQQAMESMKKLQQANERLEALMNE